MNDPRPKLSYLEWTVRNSDEVGLVLICFGLLLDDIRQSIAATTNNDPGARSSHVKHAFFVLQQLQGSLNLQEGGQAARHFDRFYQVVRGKLLEAHLRSSSATFQELLSLVEQVRDSWQQVAQQRHVDSAGPVTPTPTIDVEAVPSGWSA
ncbi:MAG TPA: flagellar protein FliS [Clostridia bacterium]|nr:flagellar protein FliS [Clostridia bacterium]